MVAGVGGRSCGNVKPTRAARPPGTYCRGTDCMEGPTMAESGDHEARIAALETEVGRLKTAINLILMSLDDEPIDTTITESQAATKAIGLPPVGDR